MGGFIAGAGVGACTVLGAGLGTAMMVSEMLTLEGTALSGASAMGLGAGTAFVTGGTGYAVRTAISGKEKFQVSDMFIEAGANTASGMMSFFGGVSGGITGVNIPGVKNGFGNVAKYQAGLAWFGVYPAKVLVSILKNRLQELH